MDIWGYVAGVLIFVVGIALSIGLHELGHFLPARRFGLTVPQFMIGFGPTLWSTKRGDTEYGIKAIPLGGYVSIPGMYLPESRPSRWWGGRLFRGLIQDARDASSESLEAGSRPFYSLPVWQRLIIMFGGPFMNLIIGTVLFGVLLLGIGVPQTTTTIQAVSECVIPATETRTECAATDPESPAAAAGLKPGDRVVAIDGQPVTEWEQGTAIIRESGNTEITISIEREGVAFDIAVTPMLVDRYAVDSAGNLVLDSDGNPVTQPTGYIGVGPSFQREPTDVGAVFVTVGDALVGTGQMILNLPEKLGQIWDASFGGAERDMNGPLSVVGVGRIAGEITSSDAITDTSRVAGLISVLASLNIALFVFNLVPLLPLDGGHIAAAQWEGIRRRIATWRGKPDPGPVDTAVLVPITIAVTVLLLGMSLLLIYADIVNPVTIF